MTTRDYVETKIDNTIEVKDIEKTLRRYQKIMQEAAANLEFETAIAYRDKIKELEKIYLKTN